MKRILVLVLALAFLLPGCSSGGGKSNLKSYDTGLGLELQLPAGFDKFDSDDFAYAISNEDNVNLDSAKMVVFVNYEGDDTLRAQGVEYRNLKEYGEAVSEGDNIKTSAGMVGDRYIFDYDYDEYYYKIVCLQGNDGYYIVNFCCFNDSKDLPKRFDEFAQAIKVKSIDQQPDHTTFSNSHFTIELPNVFKEDDDSVDHSADYAYLSYDIVDKELFDSWG
ncbi:MAG: hypothetical protein J5694_04755, partial [Erysipelotrichaceae bacterium]|nr:hypothetical protein [Erysipelotrichaceae bacterium]